VEIFERLESNVRSYSRSFPVVFDKATGPYLYDISGRQYIDFFCGAGALNYGHNERGMKEALIGYLQDDGVTHSLDMSTRAKGLFLERFESTILAPRGLQYRVQFTGPTGANGVEAALKLARKLTSRRNVIAFTQAYHGLSLGALAVTANSSYRSEAFVHRGDVAFMPYDGYLGPDVDTLEYLESVLADESSGIDRPAAIIVETIQAEGGINVASIRWLRGLQRLCRRFDIVLIVDDIQIGCGRVGTFFSFEHAGLEPDMVVLSKSISGMGLPMSLLLIRPDLDRWRPGEHTGTFRGNNAAFVTAREALRFWETRALADHIRDLAGLLERRLAEVQTHFPDLDIRVRGRGLICGMQTASSGLNAKIARDCFRRGLIVEMCGGGRNVLKLLPPLNIASEVLAEGLAILEESIQFCLLNASGDEVPQTVAGQIGLESV
jgi:diaminobutyrate-2-oxoglutarate transaminase